MQIDLNQYRMETSCRFSVKFCYRIGSTREGSNISCPNSLNMIMTELSCFYGEDKHIRLNLLFSLLFILNLVFGGAGVEPVTKDHGARSRPLASTSTLVKNS